MHCQNMNLKDKYFISINQKHKITKQVSKNNTYKEMTNNSDPEKVTGDENQMWQIYGENESLNILKKCK